MNGESLEPQDLSFVLNCYVIFEFQMQYQTAIYFPQQFAVQNPNAFSDSSHVDGSYCRKGRVNP
jgi:hypothetical protein